jgi:putative peptidoglycan lipid II flippase
MVPVLMNLIFIVAMLLADLAGWDMGLTLAWTTPVTGIIQLGFTWVAAQRAGLQVRPVWPRMTPDLRRLLVIAGPVVLSGGIVQINLVVGRQIASYTEGAVSWLVYADRLYQLPLGVVGIAIGTVLLPDLSRRLRAGDVTGSRDALNRAAEFALALTLPAAVALAIYGAGLPAFVLHKVLQPLFYAREDTARPFRYALVSMVLNVVIALGLWPLLGWSAAAWGTTLSAWGMAAQLWFGSRTMGEAATVDARLRDRLWRLVAAAAVMGLVLWGLAWALSGWLAAPGLRYGALAALVAAGIVTYGAAVFGLGALRPAELRSALRRR